VVNDKRRWTGQSWQAVHSDARQINKKIPLKGKSNYFIVRPKVDQRAGLLSLPYLRNFCRYCNVHHICLYLVSIHQRSTPLLNSATLLARLLLIYRPRRDGRLSWPSWLTHSGRLTHKVVTRQPWIRRRSGKVHRLQTDILTTEPHKQQHIRNGLQLYSR